MGLGSQYARPHAAMRRLSLLGLALCAVVASCDQPTPQASWGNCLIFIDISKSAAPSNGSRQVPPDSVLRAMGSAAEARVLDLSLRIEWDVVMFPIEGLIARPGTSPVWRHRLPTSEYVLGSPEQRARLQDERRSSFQEGVEGILRAYHDGEVTSAFDLDHTCILDCIEIVRREYEASTKPGLGVRCLVIVSDMIEDCDCPGWGSQVDFTKPVQFAAAESLMKAFVPSDSLLRDTDVIIVTPGRRFVEQTKEHIDGKTLTSHWRKFFEACGAKSISFQGMEAYGSSR